MRRRYSALSVDSEFVSQYGELISLHDGFNEALPMFLLYQIASWRNSLISWFAANIR